MYLRPAFTETDLDRIAALIAAHNFGLLVTNGPAGLDASHIPFTVARDGDALVLTGHLAAGNPQCSALENSPGMAVFSGPHAYIAPSWYIAQPAVPTWDYAAVHIHGILNPLENPRGSLRDLSEHDPGQFDLEALPELYQAQMLKGIRAFRLRSTRIEAQWKMSQNRSVQDRRSVINALRAAGNLEVAALIEKTLPDQSSTSPPKVSA